MYHIFHYGVLIPRFKNKIFRKNYYLKPVELTCNTDFSWIIKADGVWGMYFDIQYKYQT